MTTLTIGEAGALLAIERERSTGFEPALRPFLACGACRKPLPPSHVMNIPIFASRLRQRLACLLLFAAAGMAGLAAINSSRALSRSTATNEAAALRKIAPWVTAHTANGRQAEFIVVLKDQADLSGAAALNTKRAKGRFVRDALWNKKEATQGPVLQWLNDHHLEHRSFYIVNAVWVKGRAEDALALAERPDIARVEGNPEVRNLSESSSGGSGSSAA